jgi:hypothetical protein
MLEHSYGDPLVKWWMVIHFVAYRLHMEGTNRGKYIFQI